MLVLPPCEGQFRLVPQPEHAAHTAGIARYWRRPAWAAPVLWPRFLDAVRRHDDGWLAAERRPAVDAEGQPVHFTDLDTNEHLQLLLAGIDQVSSDDLYAGLLTALHFRYLETHLPGGDPIDGPLVHRFLSKVNDRIAGALAMLEKAGPSMRTIIQPDHLDASRTLLSTLDGLSLRLLGGLPWDEMRVRLPVGEVFADLTFRGEGTSATVDPWPFDEPRITVEAQFATIPQRRYATRIELADAIAEAEFVPIQTHLSPA